MAAVLIQAIPTFYPKPSKGPFEFSANIYEKYIVSEEYCNYYHYYKAGFLSNCSYYFLLIGDTEEFLQKMDAFCFTFQHVDSPYSLFKNYSSRNVVAKIGKVFDNVQKGVYFVQRNGGAEKYAQHCKKETLGEKV